MRQCDMKWRTVSYYHKGNSKLCPCPTKSLLSDKDQLARPGGGGIRSKVADSGREKSTNQKSHVYGENNSDKDGQKAQK